MNQSFYVTHEMREVYVSGKLLNWNRARPAEAMVPVLSIGGKHDTMDPEHSAYSRVQHGTVSSVLNGSHMSFYDDQFTYMRGLITCG
jgi:proline iminopeptidase